MSESGGWKKRLRYATAASVCGLAALAPLSLSAQEMPRGAGGDLLDSVNGFVDRLDRVFDYPFAPVFQCTDLYGKRISMAGFEGRIVIFSFVDQKNEDEAREWLSDQSIDYLGDPEIAFVNVLYPGRIPFIVSRGNAVDNIRREVDRFLEQMWQGLSADERERFQRTTIRWVVDWRRDLQRQFNATRDRVNIVIVDPQGRIREVIRKKTPKAVEQLHALVAELKRGKSAIAR